MASDTNWIDVLITSVSAEHSQVNDGLVTRIQELLASEFVESELTAGRRNIVAAEFLKLALEKDSEQEESE